MLKTLNKYNNHYADLHSKVYSKYISSLVIKNKEKESALDINFSVLKTLGFNPNNIIEQSDLKSTNIEWKYGEINYYILGNFFTMDYEKDLISKKFISNLENGYTYAVSPLLVSIPSSNLGSSVINLSHQIILTKHITSDKINSWLDGLEQLNSFNYSTDDLQSGIIVLKYRIISIHKNVFEYFKNKHNYNSNISTISKDFSKSIPIKNLTNNLFPYSTNISSYGILLSDNELHDGILKKKYQYKIGIQILVYEVKNNNIITRDCLVLKNNQKFINYIDYIDSNSNFYNRKIGKYSLTINKDNNYITNCEHEINSLRIEKSKRTIRKDENILTFDIECYLDKNNYNNKNLQYFVPYACGFYDGKSIFSYYLNDYDDKNHMILTCLLDIVKKYNQYTIYVHNLSGFDNYFILNSLAKYNNLIFKPFFKDNKLYSLTLELNISESKESKTHKVVFKDSYLLLNSSLRKLGKEFKVDTLKSYFPYSFVNKNNLNYIGCIPDYYHYDTEDSNLNYKDYEIMSSKYSDNNWSLKSETINYLSNDLISLYQIITSFNNEIFRNESINITSSLSISSLTSKIFNTNYYEPSVNPFFNIKGNTHEDMRRAYYGGRVDVFKSIGKKIYIYDVNSLYPYVMAKNSFPIGKPVMSYDDNLFNYFGFVYCEIQTPLNLDKPVLPFRGENGLLYNPIGNWNGMYFSEELKKAVTEFDYKVKVLYGYKFKEGKNIFSSFMNNYYNIKKEAKIAGFNSKAHTAKLLMNSLYGRYGMKPIKDIVNIVSSNESKEILLYHDVKENIILSDNIEYIKYSKMANDNLFNLKGLDYYLDYMCKTDSNLKDFNTSLPVAMAVTAYGRMYMNEFLNSNKYTVYSTDTDSLAIDKPLESKFIGEDIGQFKLECIAKNAIFLSPKLYLLEKENGNLIIKARSLGGKSLTKEDFEIMSYGLCVYKDRVNFISSLEEGGTVYLQKSKLKLSPLNLKRKTHYSLEGIINHTTPLMVKDGNLENVIIDIKTSLISLS